MEFTANSKSVEFNKLQSGESVPVETVLEGSHHSLSESTGLNLALASSQSLLRQAWDILIKLQISKGLPREFWANVERIRSRKWIQAQDIESLVTLINSYETLPRLRHRTKEAAQS